MQENELDTVVCYIANIFVSALMWQKKSDTIKGFGHVALR